MDYYALFWGPGVISTIDETQGALTRRSSTLVVLADYGAFVAYYSLFWGPGVISMINEPQGVLTRPSSTLVVLADSGPFRGLLLTVFGSRSDVHE